MVHTDFILKYLIFPLCNVLVGFLVKLTSRPPGRPIAREDFALGLDLIQNSSYVVAVLTYEKVLVLVSTKQLAKNAFQAGEIQTGIRLTENVGVLSDQLILGVLGVGIMGLVLWSVAEFVRRSGHSNKEGEGAKLHVFRGILFPLAVGLLALLAIPRYFLP